MFAALHTLAQAAPLLVSITAEGDALRVTTSCTSSKGGGLLPMVLVGTPEELDRDFATAVQIYEPSALSILQQAQAAATANSTTGKSKAIANEPAKTSSKGTGAADAPAKRGPGRPPKNGGATAPKADAPSSTGNQSDDDSENAGAPEIDPRQMSLVTPDPEPASTAAETPAQAETSAPPTDATPPAASTDPRDTGLDLPI
ncbi:PRTRC system protein E [Ralstonia solanacearum]|uniref:PRTRC system protein E n=1 Tax=Ralstonia solanacearum TaxID=305 RepID=UPI0005C77F4A|nr:PRTRC system protein E [Ralstonia solanacearum]MBB6591176.1 PRTRC system protein E [Ralstonia solanacearum]MBB6595370.1 PRTRC system protein E [Ralstonia solanacearum]MDB0541382.1 PRTRC system protein E [Ralstonia solanacearum]MDB0550704.1 PRTRC system protein E [Ralstonia solanacearum]MDB0556331.1 PRTRC system protein E [Ralstonia solanacearum]